MISRHNLAVLHHELADGKGKNMYDLAVQMKLFTPIPQNFKVAESDVQRFAYERGISEDLTAMALGVPKGDVHYIPEMGYHLDTFMRPGPKGTMWLQDYGVTVNLLRTLQESSETFNLSEVDQQILARYIKTAEVLHEDLAPLAQGVSDALIKAGVPVTPVPALFFDESARTKAPLFHVNFINGVSGYSAKTKRFYYITTGAQVGDRLGTALMDLFAWYAKKTEPKLDVFFVGRNPQDPIV